MRKFKDGDKVIIKSKSYGKPLSDSSIYRNGKHYDNWIIKHYYCNNNKDIPVYSVTYKGHRGGDYFLETDLEFIREFNTFNDKDFMI